MKVCPVVGGGARGEEVGEAVVGARQDPRSRRKAFLL